MTLRWFAELLEHAARADDGWFEGRERQEIRVAAHARVDRRLTRQGDQVVVVRVPRDWTDRLRIRTRFCIRREACHVTLCLLDLDVVAELVSAQHSQQQPARRAE